MHGRHYHETLQSQLGWHPKALQSYAITWENHKKTEKGNTKDMGGPHQNPCQKQTHLKTKPSYLNE